MIRVRRGPLRRRSDLLVHETVRLNRTLINVLQGKKANLGNILYRVRELGNEVGRREADRKVGEAYSAGPEMITRLLLEMGVIEQLPRKVRLKKLYGEIKSKFPVGTEIVGWEWKPPRLWQKYIVYLDNGLRFRTSTVQECGEGYLRTFYSIYTLKVLEEPYIGRLKQEEMNTKVRVHGFVETPRRNLDHEWSPIAVHRP